MSSFEEMNGEERQNLVQRVATCLKENGLGDVPVSTSTENVGILMAGQMQKSTSLAVSKKLKADQDAVATKFNEAVKTITEGVKGVQVSVQAQLGVGDQYKTITGIQKIDSDDLCDLEHVKGQVWMIDFWATWCPPCQRPMAHNQEMLEKRGADWGNDVRIIGLSIDQDKAKLQSHVKDKKWETVEHYYRGSSDASKVYSVSGVPHVMLIDKEGKIVFKGHPATRPNLEQDFDDLRAGKALTGAGCEASASEGDDASTALPEGYEEMDMNELEADVAAATAAIEELTKDEDVKSIASQCPRAFCVIVVDRQFNPNTGKTAVKYENYRVLVGSQENIDKLKAKIDEKVKGKFKVILRENAI